MNFCKLKYIYKRLIRMSLFEYKDLEDSNQPCQIDYVNKQINPLFDQNQVFRFLQSKGKLQNYNEHQEYNQNDQIMKESIEIVLPNQNQFPIIPKGNNLSLKELKQINSQMNDNQTDLTYFWNLWNRQDLKSMIQSFQFLVKPQNWYLNRCQYQKLLETFLNYFSALIQLQPYINQIYPGLPALIKKIQNLTQIRGNKNSIKSQQKKSNQLYKHYLEQIKSRIKREGAFYIMDQQKNEKTPLGDFIAQQVNISAIHAWRDIYFKASIYKKSQQQKQEKDPQIKRQNDRKAQIRQQIITHGSIIYPADNHLCCAQFFYFNHRIYDQVITLSPLLVTERSIKTLAEPNMLQETILDICGLLNSGGGVILFNVHKTYLEIWPKGESILQRQFSETKSKVEQGINFIYPKIEMGKEVIVSFVPICRNPITNPSKNRVTQRQYIQGLYNMRIVVKPSQDSSEYIYYYSKGNQEFKTATVQKNKRKNIARTDITKFMKRKFNSYYVSQNDYNCEDQWQKDVMKRPYSWFVNHQVCLQPQKGLVLLNRIEKESQFRDEELEQKFKYMTLIVTSQKYLPEVKKRLQSKGIQCQLTIKYNQYKFRASRNSAALYHNLRFDHLLSEVAYKKQFQFNGKYILTILVTKFIKLQNRNKTNIMAQSDFVTLQKWLHAEHPKQQLILWKYEQSRDNYEFYMQTGSKLSTLFMYYVMNHYNQKCTFKNPKDYDRLSQMEKRSRLTQFYPRQKSVENNLSHDSKN